MICHPPQEWGMTVLIPSDLRMGDQPRETPRSLVWQRRAPRTEAEGLWGCLIPQDSGMTVFIHSE